MSEIVCSGVRILLDKFGFLENSDEWNEEVALELAFLADNIFLSEEHWRLIRYVRHYYLTNGIAPMLKRMQLDTGYNLKRLYELFPQGPVKGLFRIAGMMKPVNCN